MMARTITERVIAKAVWPAASVTPPATMPTSGAPKIPAPPGNAIIPALRATKNGKAYTASVKINQQNKPTPAKFRRSPRASMVVAPFAKGYGCAFHHHHGAVLDMQSKRGGVAAMQLHLGGVEDGRSVLTLRRISKQKCRGASPCRRGCPGFPCPGNASRRSAVVQAWRRCV